MINKSTDSTKLQIQPLDFEAAGALLREKFDHYRHWLLITDLRASRIVQIIEAKYFPNSTNDDFIVIAAPWEGCIFGVASARKSMMSIRQLQKTLRAAGVFMRREEFSRVFLIIADPRNLRAATQLGAKLIGTPGDQHIPFEVQASALAINF